MLLIIYHVLEMRRNHGITSNHFYSFVLDVSTTRALREEMTVVAGRLPPDTGIQETCPLLCHLSGTCTAAQSPVSSVPLTADRHAVMATVKMALPC